MVASVLAELVFGLHVAFVVFVGAGGLLVLWRPRVAWVHLPCALWGAWVELAGWVCPLTPLENALRRRAGEAGYPGGFLEHYLAPIIYPSGLTREIQIALGVAVLVVNAAFYWVAWRRR